MKLAKVGYKLESNSQSDIITNPLEHSEERGESTTKTSKNAAVALKQEAKDGIRIVEYTPAYASSIADMWNRSRESWGGNRDIRTEQSVLQEHASSINLHTFLAVDGDEDEVVGYCSFSEYSEDENTMYVPLLNVRPDYHGKRVGRSLIQKAVETTVARGCPRLDLFTWAGNTKAVPMYKKCGFFWEKMDDATHLMNFIPTVLQTEALAPYMEQFDWYADGKRDLSIQPDGERINGFEHYTYSWAKEGRTLRVEFEKSGRGIRLVETDDYLIYAEIEHHNLVFGRSYPVRYVIDNKSGIPLHCDIGGMDDKNIRFSLERSVKVNGRTVIEGEFFVGAIEEDQSHWKTCPAVTAEVRINGRSMRLRTGIMPKFPVKLSWVKANDSHVLHSRNELYLIVENQFRETVRFTVRMPGDNGMIAWEQSQFELTLPAEGKTSLTVGYELLRFGLLETELEVQAEPDDGPSIDFARKLHVLFKGPSGMFAGETESEWMIVSGLFSVHLRKSDNEMWTHHPHDCYGTWWMYPRLGRPFSAEFSKKRAKQVNLFREDDTMVLQAVYDSGEYAPIQLLYTARLEPSGLVERYFEVEHVPGAGVGSEAGSSVEIELLDPVFHSFSHGIIPYEGQYIELKGGYADANDLWDISRLSENWMFTDGDMITRGFMWHPSLKLIQSNWHFAFEHAIGILEPGARVRTPSVYVAIGTFADWYEFRSYAVKRRDEPKPALSDHLELTVGEHNPFVLGAYNVRLSERKKQPIAGHLALTSQKGFFAETGRTYTEADQKHQVELAVSSKPPVGSIDVVRMRYTSATLIADRSKVVIPVESDTHQVRRTLERQQDADVLVCDNGTLRIAANPTFGGVLHSLEYGGREWLDTSYPEPGPKSWWNPWCGGIGVELQDMSAFSMLEETRKADFAELSDSAGNTWAGIRITTPIERHEKLKGLLVEQYYMLLPGAPVLCCTNRVVNRTGKPLIGYNCTTNGFMKPADSLFDSWIRGKGETVYRSGESRNNIPSEGVNRFGADNGQTRLHVVTNPAQTYAGAFSNNAIMNWYNGGGLRLPDGGEAMTAPVFLLFHDADLTIEQLRDLAAIHFA